MTTKQENMMVVRVQSLGEAADIFYRFLTSDKLTAPECTVFPHNKDGGRAGSVNLSGQKSFFDFFTGSMMFTSADVPARRTFRVNILQQDVDGIVAVAGMDRQDKKRIAASYIPRESVIIVSFPSESKITDKHKELVNSLIE